MIVIVIIGIIITAARPAYQDFILKSKESALRKNLYILRDAIDAYSVDHRDDNNRPKYPDTWEDLKPYLRYIPIDPFMENATRGEDSWRIISPQEADIGEDVEGQIFDVKSLSNEVGTDGKMYSEY